MYRWNIFVLEDRERAEKILFRSKRFDGAILWGDVRWLDEMRETLLEGWRQMLREYLSGV